MVNVLKFQTLFLFLYSNKRLVNGARFHIMLVRMENKEDTDQTASSEVQKQSDIGLHCLSSPFWQALNVPNFRTFTIIIQIAV